MLLPKNRVKLLLNLLLLAGGTIPRGGSLVIEPVGEGDAMGFKITSSGLNARIPQAVPGAGRGRDRRTIRSTPTRSSRSITGLLARTCGMTVTLAPEGEAIVLTRALSGCAARRPAALAGTNSIACKYSGIAASAEPRSAVIFPFRQLRATNP